MNAEIENNIRKNVQWNQLPTHIKQILDNSSKDYDRYVVNFSIKNQLRYKGNLVRTVFKNEKRYYERVVSYSRERLMLFPYHLADMIVKGLRITPFNYYISVLEKIIQAERSYDTLPNFTAADCLRLLGIGRNEYIDLMNKSRSNKGRLFGRKNVRGFLPAVPCDIHIEPWWRVEIGLVLEEDVKMVNEEELSALDQLIDCGSQIAAEFDYNTVLSLYKKGLVYLDVPVTGVDRVQVPPLQGFVMNRILGDYFETLLYKIFVSIDEHTTVSELAGVLEVETELVKQAVSLYCRLQFAKKLEPLAEQQRSRMHHSWSEVPSPTYSNVDITPLTLHLSDTNNEESLISSPDSPSNRRGGHRIAFLFDSTLTAFLMMGNLSPGLKKHAVTMFEVGKLCDESLDSFLSELEKVSVLDADGEGEARRFFDHAVILRSTVLALRKLPSPGLDLVRLESLHSLDEATCLRLLQKKYKLLVSMAPLSREVRPIISFAPPHLGPAVPEVNSLWFKLFLYHMTGYGPPSLLLIKGTVLNQLPRMFLGYSRLLVTAWLHEPAVIPVANILHVNAALQYSPVLVQAYGVHHAAKTHIVPFPFRPDTPLKNLHEDEEDGGLSFKNHPAVRNLLTTSHQDGAIVDLEHNCGYLAFVNVGVLDYGCPERNTVVRLGRSQIKTPSNSIERGIANENFTFTAELQSPDESHFAFKNSNSSSPANGFTSQEGTDLLQQELDKLVKLDSIEKILNRNQASTIFDATAFTSPSEENVNFTLLQENEERASTTSTSGEAWTLLDCQFGVPLFDVNANTKICDTIVSGGLTTALSLDELVESSRKLGTALLDFISQCQYYPGENMEIMKRGRLVPLPKHNLVFDNGKISEWTGK